MSRTRLLVLQFQDDCPPALLGGWLTALGVRLDVVRPDLGDPLPAAADVADAGAGVLVLGGSMGAHDDADVAWLPTVRDLLAALVEREVPMLGVCLGHQLLAAALGGRVRPNPRGKTAGLTPVGWLPDARDDQLVGPLAARGEALVVHWNDDVVAELPPGAVVLATTPDGDPQLVRYARRAWGVQAHPEIDAAGVRPWTARVEPERVPDLAGRLAAIEAARAELDASWRPLAASLLAILTGVPMSGVER